MLKTETKPAAKSAPKAAPRKRAAKKQEAAPVLHYAVLLAKALEGIFGQNVQRFYRNAAKYHKGEQTVFPRARLAAVALMKPEEAEKWLEAHRLTGIPSGDDEGQRLYDEMRVQSAA